jgi:membrane protease YdiL (CAAX protease family)
MQEIKKAREPELPVHLLSVELGDGEEKVGERGVLALGKSGDPGGPFACVHEATVSCEFSTSPSARERSPSRFPARRSRTSPGSLFVVLARNTERRRALPAHAGRADEIRDFPCQRTTSERPKCPRVRATDGILRPPAPEPDGRNPRPPFLPDFWQSVRLLLLEFVAIAIIGGILFLLDLPGGPGSVLSKFAILWVGWRWTRRTWRETFPVRPIRLAWLPPFALALVGLVLTIHLPSVALAEVLPPFPEWAKRAFLGAGFLDLVVLVPIVEEALFRGLILRGYLRTYRPAKAILLCGLVFAISHVLPLQFPVAFIGGVFLSWLMVETGSLVLPVIGHAFVNGVAWWMLGHPATGAAYDRHAATLWIPGVILLALGTSLLRRALRPAPRPSLTTGVA